MKIVHKKTTPVISCNHINIFLLISIFCLYFGIFFYYAVNTPFVDDFYDSLYFLHLFHHQTSLIEKLHLLFWQYNEHILTLNKLAYLLQYAVIGRIDYFWLSILGSLQLALTPYLVWLLMKTGSKHQNYFFIIPFFLFLNLALWRASYWAMTSIENIAALTLALLICLLIKHKSKHSLYVALTLLYILAFTQSNGIIMALLTNIQVLFSTRNTQEKKIWVAGSTILLTLFCFNFHMTGLIVNDLTPDTKIKILIDSIPLIFKGFLILIGSAPFFENSSAWGGVIAGIMILWMLAYMLFDLWKFDRQRFYPILTCILYGIISSMMISILRIPNDGVLHAYDSHYKMYSLFFLGIIALFFAEKIHSKFLMVAFFMMMLSISFVGSMHYFPVMVQANTDRRNEITEWTIHGTRSSLGFSGWPYLSEQILFMAMREKIYSPFDTYRSALNQAKNIGEISSCPTGSDHQIESEITNIKGTIALSISTQNTADSFDSIYMCSEHHAFHIVAPESGAHKIILEKNKITPDQYTVYFSKGNNVGRSKSILTINNETIGLNCEPFWGRIHAITLQARNEFCKHAFK